MTERMNVLELKCVLGGGVEIKVKVKVKVIPSLTCPRPSTRQPGVVAPSFLPRPRATRGRMKCSIQPTVQNLLNPLHGLCNFVRNELRGSPRKLMNRLEKSQSTLAPVLVVDRSLAIRRSPTKSGLPTFVLFVGYL